MLSRNTKWRGVKIMRLSHAFVNKFYKMRFKSKILFFLCLLFSQNNLVSQKIDFADLTFNSYFEEQAFYELEDQKPDYFKILLAVDKEITKNKYELYKREINIELDKIRTRKFEKARPEKKVELVFNQLNQDIFFKYTENVNLTRVFSDGSFNCLTASAYYGIIFDSLGIEFNIMESKNHVHPVAYPSNLQIIVETTDPVLGVKYFDERLKKQFVEYLLESKLITRDDYYTKNSDELFNQYYFPDSGISMRELAGLQYMNDALFLFHMGDFPASLEQIKKACYLYPSRKIETILRFLLDKYFRNTQMSSLEDIKPMIIMSRIPAENIDLAVVENIYGSMTQFILFDYSEEALYDSIFNYLNKYSNDGAVKQIITFNYYYYKGKYLNAGFKFKEALTMFEKAFVFNTRNVELQSLFISTLAMSFRNSSNEEANERLEYYSSYIPELNDNGMFLSFRMSSCLYLAEEKFDFGLAEEALAYIQKFEDLYNMNPDVSIDYDQVGRAYSAAAVYFFKKYQRDKAKEFLQRGLAIAPDNLELKYRLRSI
jgi:tetratricopeptide (TPR) repeat protein